ncbi:unnamed protein product [Prunus armeniaca]|uniref:Amine oxidase n=1 Tax=Prunus armeniaca TaxID=36596 RepID=A0A6J5XGN6_PRUAR|nr:unnamed protein product [Prunus armeniaca]CAB4311112.1 unnamed protein product [Prunus armeniaca]
MFLRRAAFLKHNLWVTPYACHEMFAGGEFPEQNPRVGEGLATWVKQDRPLEETDILLWYVFGKTHVARLEDLSCQWSALGLCSCCSPAVDVPPSPCESLNAKPTQSGVLPKL